MLNPLVRSRILPFAALAIATLLLTVPFLPQELVRDSAGWASWVNMGSPNMWHPHHLIYLPVNWIFLQILSPFCAQCDAIQAGQLHSLLWSVIMVLSVYSMIRHLTGQPLLGVVLSLLLLVSQSVWVLALQPQAYVPLLGTIGLLFAFLVITKNHPYSWKWVFAVSLLYGLSVLFHQAMVLLCVPLTYYIISTKGANGIRGAASVLLLSGMGVLVLYLWATRYVMGELTAATFIEYITTFSQVMTDPGYFSFGNYSIANVAVLLNSQLDAFTVAPWALRAPAQFAFNMVMAGVLLWNVLRARAHASNYQERVFLLVTIFVFWALTLWGNPADDGWPSFVLLPVIVLLGITLADFIPAMDRVRTWKILFTMLLAVLIVGVAIRNFNERIYPMHLDKGEHYRYAQSMASVIPIDCAIYDMEQLRYYNLQYYFSRKTLDYWDYITAAYYGDAEIKGRLFGATGKHECVAVDVNYLNPGFVVVRNTGEQLPEQWFNFVAWMFGLSRDDDGQLSWREFSVASADNGHSYFIIRPHQSTHGSLKQFWKTVVMGPDDEAGSVEGFVRWNSAFCAKVERGMVGNDLAKSICLDVGA